MVGLLTGVPLAVNFCAWTCESHRATSSTPTCHHANASKAGVAGALAPCGHDHHVQPMLALTSTEAGLDSSALPYVTSPGSAELRTTGRPLRETQFSPPSFLAAPLLQPLRI
jgi:hypothetical protein